MSVRQGEKNEVSIRREGFLCRGVDAPRVGTGQAGYMVRNLSTRRGFTRGDDEFKFWMMRQQAQDLRAGIPRRTNDRHFHNCNFMHTNGL